MKKSSNLNGDFEYELLDENQQYTDLKEKVSVLYPTPFADILWWKLRNPSLGNNKYYKLFYYEQSVLKHIILFKFSSRKIFVLNREIKISIIDIQNICHILFSEFGKVKQIIFKDIFDPSMQQMPKMIFEITSNDVIILDLPDSMDSYIKSLGSNTRKRVKLATNHIARDFPDYKVQYYEKSDISFESIEKVVSLNRDRMKTKGMKSNLDDLECKMTYRYASESGFGFLCTCTIDDKIIGGTINSIVGQHAYMHIIAHDNSYNKYSIGLIALIQATKYLIEEKNIKDYHLLLGTQEYKFRHGGINHDLYTIRVFKKNGLYFLLGKVMKTFRTNYRKLRKGLKNNKTFYNFYIKLNTIKMKIQGV